jgi:hypothetical protein
MMQNVSVSLNERNLEHTTSIINFLGQNEQNRYTLGVSSILRLGDLNMISFRYTKIRNTKVTMQNTSVSPIGRNLEHTTFIINFFE